MSCIKRQKSINEIPLIKKDLLCLSFYSHSPITLFPVV
nr:MAG TPA: hypothetical protein [Caudoviricetes sp.]